MNKYGVTEYIIIVGIISMIVFEIAFWGFVSYVALHFIWKFW